MSNTDKPKRPSFREAWRSAVEQQEARAAAKRGPEDKATRIAREITQSEPEPKPSDPTAPVKRGMFDARNGMFIGTDGSFTLYPDGVDYSARGEKRTLPLNTIRAVTLEDGEELQSRITATRLVLVGVFALAFKKKRGGEKFLAIESDDAFVVVEVNRKKIRDAQKFAAKVRTAAKGAH